LNPQTDKPSLFFISVVVEMQSPPANLVRAVELIRRLHHRADTLRKLDLKDIHSIVTFVYNIVRGVVPTSPRQRSQLEQKAGQVIRKLISKRQLPTLKAKRLLLLRHATIIIPILASIARSVDDIIVHQQQQGHVQADASNF
jgi:hypothetical protein